MLKGTVRYIWSRKSKDVVVQHGIGNCGKPLPPCMDLTCKGCPSKCLEFEKPKKKSFLAFFSCKQEPPKEKPSNCRKVEKPPEEKLTWWEKIFGPNPRRSWPDPCTCRLAHRQRKRLTDNDSRLNDSRYKITAGDVLLYTEPIKLRCDSSSSEPQPKSPPPYKIPKAVYFKMLSDISENVLTNRMIFESQPCQIDKDAHLTSYRLPYEELRPPEKRRGTPFDSQRGILPEDISLPLNRNMNVSGVFQQQPRRKINLLKELEEAAKKEKQSEDKSNLDSEIQKQSRIERLKYLVQQRDMSHCKSSFCS